MLCLFWGPLVLQRLIKLESSKDIKTLRKKVTYFPFWNWWHSMGRLKRVRVKPNMLLYLCLRALPHVTGGETEASGAYKTCQKFTFPRGWGQTITDEWLKGLFFSLLFSPGFFWFSHLALPLKRICWGQPSAVVLRFGHSASAAWGSQVQILGADLALLILIQPYCGSISHKIEEDWHRC